MNIREAQTAVQQELARHQNAMIQFLRDLVAIPSFASQIGPVGDAVGARMSDLGFDEVRRDSMGNILGRVGDGPRIVLYDSHIDTVRAADAGQSQWDLQSNSFHSRGREIASRIEESRRSVSWCRLNYCDQHQQT